MLQLHEAEKRLHSDTSVPIVQCVTPVLRLVLLSSCQSGCDFCHLESKKNKDELGTLNPALVAWKTSTGNGLERFDGVITPEMLNQISELIRAAGYSSVHLTGGEPTLHPLLGQYVSQLVSVGVRVGMTTHGEYDARSVLLPIIAAGLQQVVFSMHSATPEEYLSMDLVAQSIMQRHGKEKALLYAGKRLGSKMRSIRLVRDYALSESSSAKLPKINCVVSSLEQALSILQWGWKEGVVVRLQKDLNNKPKSKEIIAQLIEHVGAVPILEKQSLGDSSSSGIVYRTAEGNEFAVKDFSPVFAEAMCGDCEARNTPDCRENYYGLRIEAGPDNTAVVRACIDRTIPGETVFPILEFLNSVEALEGIPFELMKNYYLAISALEE